MLNDRGTYQYHPPLGPPEHTKGFAIVNLIFEIKSIDLLFKSPHTKPLGGAFDFNLVKCPIPGVSVN